MKNVSLQILSDFEGDILHESMPHQGYYGLKPCPHYVQQSDSGAVFYVLHCPLSEAK